MQATALRQEEQLAAQLEAAFFYYYYCFPYRCRLLLLGKRSSWLRSWRRHFFF
jgi:hypothetical protein